MMDAPPFSDMDWLDTAAQTLDRAMQENLYSRFSQSKTDFDRVQFMHEHRTQLFSSTFERYFSSPKSIERKNPSKAIEYRKQGNEYFVNKNLSRAACCYRASIALSNVHSQDMALSYGNLSAVLFELNLYHESIRAIQLASDDYPKELKFKLVFRRAACYHKLHDPERSAQELKICRDLIKQTTGLDRKKIDAFCREMDQLSEQTTLLTQRKEQEQRTSYQNLDDLVQRSATPSDTLAKALLLSSNSESKITDEFRPPSPPSPPRTLSIIDESKLLYKGAHRSIACASSVLRVIYSKEKGRHLIATEDIPADALILSERPYACLLLPKFAYTYCDHCLTSIVIPHVCSRCSDVLFCSEFCQEKALNTYHRYECDYIHILKTLGIGFLAYRTLTSTDREILRSIVQFPSNDIEKQSTYKSDYAAIQRLITHSDQMSIDDLFHYSLTAYFLSEMIKLSGYLPLTNKDKSLEEQQLLLSSILLKHIQQMICNAQTISIPNDDLLSSQENEDPINRRFASAIFPTCALMNHSCLPNIRCIFDQGCLHVQSARLIRKGEEILNCYGPQKTLMPSTEQRQTILYEQYFFKCQCEGCVESKCNGGKVKTSLSRSNVDQKCFYQITSEKLSEAKRLFTQSLSSLSQNQTSVEQGLVLLENSIRFYERLIGEINLDTVHLYEYVASIYNDQHQFEQTSLYLSKCISILKRNISPTCSSNTILLVDVLRKYAQTLFNCRKFDDARRTIAEAQFLLDQISPITLNEEDSSSNNHVLQTMEDLKAKCDLCIG